jgi:hypothetical protein
MATKAPKITVSALGVDPAADVAALAAAALAADADAALADAPIPMRHPDNGACDRYETDENGDYLVPPEDAALMLEHGFVVVDASSTAE